MGLNDVIKFFISGDGAKYGLIVGGVVLGVAAIAYININSVRRLTGARPMNPMP